MAIYGKTWWGNLWLEHFTEIDEEGRLAKGKADANAGRVYGVKIYNSSVSAKTRSVKQTRAEADEALITFKPFDSKQQDLIREFINSSPAILSALINKQLPSKLFEQLEQNNIHLFPNNWVEDRKKRNWVSGQCSCCQKGMPCKHVAALIYALTVKIDRNPLILFQLHGCDLLKLVSDFSKGALEQVQNVPKIERFFADQNIEVQPCDPTAWNAIHFSRIPELKSTIIGMLKNDPPFYGKNFRAILASLYEHWKGHARGQIEYEIYYGLNISAAECHKIVQKKKKRQPLDEEEFLAIWSVAEKWEGLSLKINKYYQLSEVFGHSEEFSESTRILSGPYILTRLLLLLQDIPHTRLHHLSPGLRYLHLLFEFAIHLMEKSALIPQLFQVQKTQTVVRWIPALFNPEVQAVYQQLCAHVPANFVHAQDSQSHELQFFSAQEQVAIALDIIFACLMTNNCGNVVVSRAEMKVFELFFSHKPVRFQGFVEREVPTTLAQWLSNLYLAAQKHQLYLTIEEKGNAFELNLKVRLENQDAPQALLEMLKIANPECKLSILSDLGLVIDCLPQLAEIADDGRGVPLNAEEIFPIFVNMVPIFRGMGIEVLLPKSLQRVLKPKLTLNLIADESRIYDRTSFLHLKDLLHFDWTIAIGNKQLSKKEFTQLRAHSRGLVRLVDEYVLLDEKEIELLLKQINKLPADLSQMECLQAALAGEWEGAQVNLDHQLKGLFSEIDQYIPVQIPSNLQAILRPYQERGFHWLVQNIEMGFGSILADDMGLGKTLQVIAAVLHFKNKNAFNAGKVLIIVPTTLISNWQKEIQRFAPDLKVSIYHGQKRVLTPGFDILLTSYGLARRDAEKFNAFPWFLIVVDEAQNIKNPRTEQTQAIKSIQAQHKIAMSGTPVENRLLEYWSIFDFVNRHYLGSEKRFWDAFAGPIEKERDLEALERFKKVTAPFLLRRIKSDKTIIQDLPDKIESNRYCSLTAEQAALYEEVVQRSLDQIEESSGIQRKGLVLKLINALKQICNHPAHYGKKKTARIDQSGKMAMLEEILVEVEDLAEKALIFTQYTEMGDIMVQLLTERFKQPIPFLHGGLSRGARDEMVDHFQKSSQARFLILSLKAGGTGLNLTAATHVIHYDLWWNPAVEGQATDRAYRIGQNQKVMVYRLLNVGTFEERIDEMIQSKKELAHLAVENGESWITEMSTKQLKELIALRGGGI